MGNRLNQLLKAFFAFTIILIAFSPGNIFAQRLGNADFNVNPKAGCAIPHVAFFTDKSEYPDVWYWEFGDGGNSTKQNPTHVYTSTGTFIVKLTVRDTVDGSFDTHIDTVVVSDSDADYTGSPTTGCGPLTVDFSDASIDAVSWEWDFGDGGTSTDQNPSYTYDKPGDYTVSLKTTNSSGCDETLTKTNYIQVTGPDVNFEIAAKSGTMPLTVVFNNLTILNAALVEWSWNFGDGGTSNALNPIHTYTTAGTYNVSLMVTDIEGCSRTLTKNGLVNTGSSVTINQAAGQSDPSNSSTVNFTVVFNEPVTGFTTGDVTLSGTAGATTGTVTEIAPNDGTTYSIAVTGMTTDGTVIASIAAGVAENIGNVGNLVSTSTDNIVTYDTTPPVISIGTPSLSLTNSGPVSFSVTYSGATSISLSVGDITLNKTGSANGTVSVSNGATSTPTVTISGISGDGTLGISVASAKSSDAAGNTDVGAGPSTTLKVDNTAPTVSIGSPSLTNTNNGPVTYSITYTGATAINLTDGDIILNKTGSANGTVAVTNGSTSTPTVTISGITGDGTLGISVASAKSSDAAGNTDAGAGPSETFSVDNTAPTVSIGSPSLTNTNNGPVTYSITYTGATTINLTDGDITLNKTGSANGIVSVSNGKTASPTVTITGITGDGTLGITIKRGSSSDAIGNKDAGSEPSTLVSVDNTLPAVAVSSPSKELTTSGSVSFGVTYSNADSVNLKAGDVLLNNAGTASGVISVTDGKTLTPTVTISNITGSGSLGIKILPGSSSDKAGNKDTSLVVSDQFIVNSAPNLASLSKQQVNEDDTLMIKFDLVDTDQDTLNYTVKSDNENIVVSIKKNKLSIIPKSNWNGSGSISVTASDKYYSASISFIVEVLPVNDAPVLSNIEFTKLSYTEGSEGEGITGSILIEDIDSKVVTQAKISIIENYVPGEDQLIFPSENGLTGNWDFENGILTINGNASLLTYQSALRNVTYRNLSSRLTASSRKIGLSVTDGEKASSLVTRGINIIPANDAPRIFAIESSVFNYTENDGAKVITDSLVIVDVDSPNLTSASFSISENYHPEEDQLLYTAQNNIEGIWDSEIGTVILSGNNTVENYRKALRSIVYSNTSENPSSLVRTLSIKVTDGEKESNLITRKIKVTNVNDKPEINFQSNRFTFKEDEEVIYQISQLYPFIYDPDNADSTLIITLQNKSGKIEINEISPVTVKFKPEENWFGLDTITVTVSDGTLNTSASFVVNILPVNDIPHIEEMDPLEITTSDGVILNIFKIVSDIETADSLLIYKFGTATDSVISSYNAKTGELLLKPLNGYKGLTKLNITVIDQSGDSTKAEIELEVDMILTGISSLIGIPEEYELLQNYPNPFNPTTKIKYGLPKASRVKIMIYNILGEVVSVLKDGENSAGYQEIDFNGSNLSSGIYIYGINAYATDGSGEYQKVKKMMLIK